MTSVRAVSAEFDLLCSMVRPRPDLAGIRGRIVAGVDFDILLELAAVHGVRPMLLLALSVLSWKGVPGAIRTALQHFQKAHLMRVLSLADEACRIARLFEAEGVHFAVFKGPALAAYLYGDISRREYNDIDVLVPPGQMANAEALLTSLGFGNRQGDRAFRQAFLAYQRQYAFVRAEFDAAIDLHWHFSSLHLPFPVQPNDIWPSLVAIPVGACTVPSLCDVDLALMLAGHGTKESWKSLSWICDFATFIERTPDIDWLHIHGRARAQRSGDAILLGCAMASGLLGTPVPAALSKIVAGSRRVCGMAETLIADMRQGLSHISYIKPNFVDHALCESWIDRMKVMSSLAVTPTPTDYFALPLPPALWPLYYVMRPLRLALRAAGLSRARTG